jgi:hypothetical protein
LVALARDGYDVLLGEALPVLPDRSHHLNPIATELASNHGACQVRGEVGTLTLTSLRQTPSGAGPEHPDEQEEYDGTDEGHQDHAWESGDRHAEFECAEDPAAEHGADDPDHDVTDQAVSDYGARQQSGDESDDEPGKNVHNTLQGKSEPTDSAAR